MVQGKANDGCALVMFLGKRLITEFVGLEELIPKSRNAIEGLLVNTDAHVSYRVCYAARTLELSVTPDVV